MQSGLMYFYIIYKIVWVLYKNLIWYILKHLQFMLNVLKV